ncbi:salicylaldehyde dehydrogenase [Pokkaliibacter plantistimulans]|uniref:Salicylaldehyde dehydrogenase n=1 Tax=Proteobacteria bacterium 228 TaxID=2083153 RepID=A0A2S5KTW7_9PROT|nr:aldehyde dehydrogenase [Pokkaliibacter plantistimulans]PPC78095.1 salicylaldehyde dehydrogenase [Pokkaliibacter plantistimulans]
MLTTQLLINGEFCEAQQGRTYDRIDPILNQTATRAAAATPADAVAAARAAAAAFPGWSATAPNERRRILLKAADLLEARTPDFIEAMQAETGASAIWAGFNCHLAAGHMREAAALTTQMTGEVIPSDKPGSFAMAVRQALGVCVGIAPWNAPVILGVRALATPLACGNTVVFKASELCPKTHVLIADVLQEAGLPKGVLNVITNAPEEAATVVEALINEPCVRHVNFTGSTRVGRIIAELCASKLKRCVLELGGKAPLLVLDDADIDAAVNAAAFGAFMNQGQICMSTERLIVDNAVADEFVEKLKLKALGLKAGNPRTENVPLGSMIGADAAARVKSMVEESVAKGAVLVAGGQVDGAIMQPTVVDHIVPSMSLYRDESFGPVLSIIRVNSDEEAITIANDSDYGLSAAVFSKDISRAMNVARRIDSGICHINSATVHDEAQMPFGGVKDSGWGRFGGKAGIAEFTDLRWMTIQTADNHYPF